MQGLRNKKLREEKPSKKMFLRLFNYLQQGGNTVGSKMKMTVPVWMKMNLTVCSEVLTSGVILCIYRMERSPKICAFTLPKNFSPTPQNP